MNDDLKQITPEQLAKLRDETPQPIAQPGEPLPDCLAKAAAPEVIRTALAVLIPDTDPVCTCHAPRDTHNDGFSLHLTGCPRWVPRAKQHVASTVVGAFNPPLPEYAKPRLRLHVRQPSPSTPYQRTNWCISVWKLHGHSWSFYRTQWCGDASEAFQAYSVGAMIHRQLDR